MVQRDILKPTYADSIQRLVREQRFAWKLCVVLCLQALLQTFRHVLSLWSPSAQHMAGSDLVLSDALTFKQAPCDGLVWVKGASQKSSGFQKPSCTHWCLEAWKENKRLGFSCGWGEEVPRNAIWSIILHYIICIHYLMVAAKQLRHRGSRSNINGVC